MINFPIDSIRKDFPILGKKINNNDIVYFDNAATTQKPNAVINAIILLFEEKYFDNLLY